jgi:hypothetical protein
MYYIRFTADIEADIERGFSTHFNGGAKLPGLCAWKVMDNNLSPYASNEEIIEAAKKTAEMIIRNTYGGYSSKDTYAVLKGTYVGSSNDGVCIRVDAVVSIQYL